MFTAKVPLAHLEDNWRGYDPVIVYEHYRRVMSKDPDLGRIGMLLNDLALEREQMEVGIVKL